MSMTVPQSRMVCDLAVMDGAHKDAQSTIMLISGLNFLIIGVLKSVVVVFLFETDDFQFVVFPVFFDNDVQAEPCEERHDAGNGQKS